jgi:hypothetical protein
VLWFIYNWQGFASFSKKGKELANEHWKEPRPQDHEKWVPILEKNKMMGIICFPLEAAVEVFHGVVRHFKKIPSVFGPYIHHYPS